MMSLLKIPPPRRHEEVLVSSLSYAESMDILRQSIRGPVPWYKPDFLVKRFSFKGQVWEAGFRMERILTLGDMPDREDDVDGVPVSIFGELDPSSQPLKIRIIVKQRATPLKYIVMARWFGILLMPGILIGYHLGLVSLLKALEDFAWLVGIFFILPPFVPSLYTPEQFGSEVDVATDFLCGLLQARPERLLQQEAALRQPIEMQ